ncbi:protein YgfX [Legionella rowbothamii]|uniref:protein YgfX n=1 Tax=Legionella rowbothamii TaxID=96229 RepID=UPI003BF82725
MSHLSEINIKLGPSEIYFRLVVVISLLTTGLIFYSALYLAVKLILLGFLLAVLRFDWLNKKPRNGIKEIRFRTSKWILVFNNNKSQDYQEAQVLLHNVLFQLIQFTHLTQKKYVILFIDQISESQFRQLHLKLL